MLRYLTAGESHGRGLVAVLDGLPAGLGVSAAAINSDLARRQRGHGRGGRQRIEHDEVEILSGVRGGLTLGSPVTLLVRNRDWANWSSAMAAEPGPLPPPLTAPRPGHADLPGALKFSHRDIRNVLERASARETAARVAAGAVARLLLAAFGVDVLGHVLSIGAFRARPWRGPIGSLRRLTESSPVRCADSRAASAMIRAIDRAARLRDTIGGEVEVRAAGLPPGLGSFTQWDARLDGRLAAAVMSVQAVKGVAIGDAFAVAAAPGSRAHDEIRWSGRRGYFRRTNRAGGVEGGMTNGEELVIRAALKPISTLRRPLRTVDLATHRPVRALVERSDVCMVPAAAVVVEAAVALELARAFGEKFGGDSLGEMRRNHRGYLKALRGS
ncbi:MAG: chorismate synthase [Candidatus Coatesbacteria bacterium]